MYNIREYRIDDKTSLIRLIRLNTPAYFSVEEEPGFSHYLDHELERYYVIEHEGEVIGCGGINFEDDYTTGIISWDMVHPDFHGRGVGSELLKFRLTELSAIGSIERIIVRTSQLTHIFYAKHGFQLIDIKKDFWAEGLDLYKMEYFQKNSSQ